LEKSLFSKFYRPIPAMLVQMRKEAGLSQAQLAERLKKPPSFVAKIEQSERRLDLLEFYWICEACGFPPAQTIQKVLKSINHLRSKKP
jgi:transcriptional regulator with XRE-family HTH domain